MSSIVFSYIILTAQDPKALKNKGKSQIERFLLKMNDTPQIERFVLSKTEKMPENAKNAPSEVLRRGVFTYRSLVKKPRNP